MLRRSLILYAWLLAMLLLCQRAPARERRERFSRTRHRAAVLVLLGHNTVPGMPETFAGRAARLKALGRSFIQEGGYHHTAALAILGIENMELERAAQAFRYLERRRYGQKADAMPSAAPRTRPGALQLVCVATVAYTRTGADGCRAARHLAAMVDGDPQMAAVATAAHAMLGEAIAGETDKRALITAGAASLEDENLRRHLWSIRVREWDEMVSEDTALGRLLRPLHIWHRAADFEQAMKQMRRLRYIQSRHFLAVLSAAWYDLPNLPEPLVHEAMRDPTVPELAARLYDLARDGVLVAVPEAMPKRILPQEPLARQSAETTPYVDTEPTVAAAQALRDFEKHPLLEEETPLPPPAPAAPTTPVAPAPPSAPSEPAQPPELFTDLAATKPTAPTTPNETVTNTAGEPSSESATDNTGSLRMKTANRYWQGRIRSGRESRLPALPRLPQLPKLPDAARTPQQAIVEEERIEPKNPVWNEELQAAEKQPLLKNPEKEYRPAWMKTAARNPENGAAGQTPGQRWRDEKNRLGKEPEILEAIPALDEPPAIGESEPRTRAENAASGPAALPEIAPVEDL